MRTTARPILTLMLLPALLVAHGARAEEPAAASFDKGFQIASEDGDYLLRIRGYVQPRFALFLDDEGDGADGVTELGFRVRRGRVYLQGHVFGPEIRYSLQLDFARSTPLLDWYGEFDLNESLFLRAGQYKIPFSRQFLASSSKLQLVERSLATNAFTENGDVVLGDDDETPLVDRDIGLMAGWRQGPATLFVGVFNGNGLNQRRNDNTDLAYAARLEVNPFGEVKDDEGAAKVRSTLLGVGLSAVVNPIEDAGTPWQLGADVALWTGPFAIESEAFYRRFEPAADVTRTDLGFHVQGGWLVLPERGLELAARYAWLDLDTDDEDVVHELTVGPNLYLHGHELKVQANYVATLPTAEGESTRHGVLLQTTLGFK